MRNGLDSEQLVTVATFPDLTSAQFFQSLLEENGIVAFVPNETVAALNLPPFVTGIDRIYVQVPESRVDDATALLRDMAERAAQAGDLDETGPLEAGDAENEQDL